MKRAEQNLRASPEKALPSQRRLSMILLSGCMVGPTTADLRRQRRMYFAVLPLQLPTLSPLPTSNGSRSSDESSQELIRERRWCRTTILRMQSLASMRRAPIWASREPISIPTSALGPRLPVLELSTAAVNLAIPAEECVQPPTTFGDSVPQSALPIEIDIWGRLRRATEAARAELLATDWNRKTVITTLVSDVATAYFNLLESRHGTGHCKETHWPRAQESLRLISFKRKAVSRTLLDVRQGRAVGLRRRAARYRAQSSKSSKPKIKSVLLLGKNPGPVTRGRSLTEQQTPPQCRPACPRLLLERRPDIQAAEQTPSRPMPTSASPRQPIFRKLR